MRSYRKALLPALFAFVAMAIVYCGPGEEKKKEEAGQYLNLSVNATYVGMNTCRQCHMDKYRTFIHTGMGQSFDRATRQKSAAKFGAHDVIYDRYSDLYYHPYWQDSSLYIKEFRLEGKDTVHQRVEKVDYIIGSGQHTNSHIFSTNGYLCQMPMTFYTQKGQWDLPPGFENGYNTRFSRKIGLECMACHNSYPEFYQGSENKYNFVASGISCERCHGPGSVHVAEKQKGNIVDTSRYIDYTIVNPAKLPIGLQFDVCQRCHLQGNAVLKEGKSFFDFRPGMKLSDVEAVFLPKYQGAEDEFIMASHADRLKMSQCFIKSFKEDSKNLRPYKDAMTCVTCHNPHVSVKVTGKEVFNNACKNCHGGKVKMVCTENMEVRSKVQDNCVSCHMPRSGSIDIPHVTVTDHFIRKPVKKEDVAKIKKFIGLFAINEASPSGRVKAEAFLNQLEKFDEHNFALLDSAKKYLPDATVEDVSSNLGLLVRLNYLKGDFGKIVSYVNSIGAEKLLNEMLVKKSYDNNDAWTCYRIGEACVEKLKQEETSSHELLLKASGFYGKAVELAPYNYEFRIKHGSVLFRLSKKEEAKKIFETTTAENPKYAPALCNLGYCYFEEKNYAKAEELYNKAIALDPDYQLALINKVNLLKVLKRDKEAEKLIERIKKLLVKA